MKKKEVDARGLACPQPVVLTKKALDETPEGEILVLVDTENARDNVVRLAESQGCAATTRQAGLVPWFLAANTTWPAAFAALPPGTALKPRCRAVLPGAIIPMLI